MNAVVRRFGNDFSRGSAPNRDHLPRRCQLAPLGHHRRDPWSLITLSPTNRKGTRWCLSFLTNRTTSSSIVRRTPARKKLTRLRRIIPSFLFFFFFFFNRALSFFHSFFPFPLRAFFLLLSFVSPLQAKLMRFRERNFREKNEAGDLSRRDEINDFSWWDWRRGTGRNKNRKFPSPVTFRRGTRYLWIEWLRSRI